MDGIIFFIRAPGSKCWGKWGSGSKERQENRDQWVLDIPCYDPAIFYWQSNTFTRTGLRRSHQMTLKRARLYWGLKQVLGSNMIPVRTKFDTQTTVISHRRRKQFSSSAGLLFRSEFSDRQSNAGFGDKSIVFQHFPRKFRTGQLGMLTINLDFRNVIFSQWNFPSSGRSTNENLWEIVASSPFLSPSRLRLSLTQIGELARRLRVSLVIYQLISHARSWNIVK